MERRTANLTWEPICVPPISISITQFCVIEQSEYPTNNKYVRERFKAEEAKEEEEEAKKKSKRKKDAKRGGTRRPQLVAGDTVFVTEADVLAKCEELSREDMELSRETEVRGDQALCEGVVRYVRPNSWDGSGEDDIEIFVLRAGKDWWRPFHPVR